MACSEADGHPLYREGRAEDTEFEESELLYRRYLGQHFENQKLLPASLRFPRPSFNRQKYSNAEDVLHPDCCNGAMQGGWGVLECQRGDVPSPIIGPDGRSYRFEPRHAPLDCCYAHAEIWCFEGDADVWEPSKKVREEFRVKLALAMRVRIAARV